MSIGLYVHIPFCKRKCKYCSFFSKENSCVDEGYIDELVAEISAKKIENLSVDTIFIGGGTPSLLSFSQLRKIFQTINSTFSLDDNCEISIELNPDSVDREYLKSLKSLGINRVSFGVQSFSDKELRLIGRLHNAEKAYEIIKTAGEYFANINLDLMIGLPEQTEESFAKTLSMATELPITHISVYSLILEERTPIFQMVENGLQIPDEDKTVELYDFAVDELKKFGFERYEISNFAKKTYECKHNQNCWRFKEYIGVGASAHSFFKNERFSNKNTLIGFSKERISYENNANDRIAEYLMLALRTREGINKQDFFNRFRENFDIFFRNALSKNEIMQTCVNDENHFYIKEEYIYISNSIIVLFFEEI